MYLFSKRILDVLISSIALILLFPILLPISIILRFSAEGYIFYYQERIGLNRGKFNIIKFATMLKDSPNLGTGSITLTGDWRVTKPGKLLRKTKINEIPQIIKKSFGQELQL